MKDPRFKTPPSFRPIKATLGRRAVFYSLGILAAIVRIVTAPWRKLRGIGQPRDSLLIVEPFGMGDVLALQPLANAWLERGASVTVAARSVWHELLPARDGLACLDLRPSWAANGGDKYKGAIWGPHGLFATARSLRKRTKGTVGVDVRGDVRSILLLYLAGCRKVETLAVYYTANDSRVFPGAARRKPIDENLERWRLNGVFSPDTAEFESFGPPSVRHLAAKTKAHQPTDAKKLVALVVMTPWPGKRWFPACWRKVAAGLDQRGLSPVIVCGPGESEEARRECSDTLPLRECSDIREWIEALESCAGVISVNTGPMHLAAALELPLVVLEGSSRLPLWAPSNPNSRVVHHQDLEPCAPCHQVGDVAQTCARCCMAWVLPSEVLAAFDELYKEN